MKEPYYKGYIASYRSYLADSPYVREVMKRLIPLTEEAQSMLDIGAGTGVFSLLVAPHVHVTALEPSEAMRATIAEQAKAEKRRVTLIAGDWETTDVMDGSYDTVLCANAVYTMHPLDEMLMKMVRTARCSVLIVMNGRTDMGFYGKMRRALKSAGIACPDALTVHKADALRRTLDRLGIAYEEELATWQDVRRFEREEDALDYLIHRYEVSPSMKEQAEEILTPYITHADDAYTICDDTTMTFITVRKNGQ